MKPATMAAAISHLPATREQLAERLGRSYCWTGVVARQMLAERLAEEWGREPSSAGRLQPVLHATEKGKQAANGLGF